MDPVTKIDLASEALILERLMDRFPSHRFLSEETRHGRLPDDAETVTWVTVWVWL